MLSHDRTVHGKTADGGTIVRYDRASKWYVEYGDGRTRRHVSIDEAAKLAVEGEALLGRSNNFDRRVRALRGGNG